MDDALAKVAGKRQRVPDNVVYYDILPRLSFKTLSRFTSVCKDWHAFISGKSSSSLASEQSRRPSAVSVAFVSLSASGGLEFLPPAGPVAVPDPFLSFIPLPNCSRKRIVASAGGLLCLHLTHRLSSSSSVYKNVLYVVNPATKQGQLVPHSGNRYYSVGLAFDPSNSPNRYCLVRVYKRDAEPHHSDRRITVSYRFDVFSSETGRWVKSRQQVRLRSVCYLSMKPVYAQGVVYWRCLNYLLWYDVVRDLAGSFALPKKRRGTLLFLDNIGVHEGGQLSCTRVVPEALELWLRATPCGPWQKVHEKSWGEMIAANLDAFGFCNTATLRRAELQVWTPWDLLGSRFVWPLCFAQEENKLYLGVKALKIWSEPRVVCYDISTGKVVDTGKVTGFWNTVHWTFSYHNSMAALPKIGEQSSVDEKSIWEGSSEI